MLAQVHDVLILYTVVALIHASIARVYCMQAHAPQVLLALQRLIGAWDGARVHFVHNQLSMNKGGCSNPCSNCSSGHCKHACMPG